MGCFEHFLDPEVEAKVTRTKVAELGPGLERAQGPDQLDQTHQVRRESQVGPPRHVGVRLDRRVVKVTNPDGPTNLQLKVADRRP